MYQEIGEDLAGGHLCGSAVFPHNIVIRFYIRLGLILFRKHLKSYLKDLPVTDDVCGEMVVAKTVAEFERLLAQLEGEFGGYAILVLAQMEDGRHSVKYSTQIANSSPSIANHW